MSLLGLAQKAGKIVSGELAVEKAVRSGKAKLIVVAADGSDNTKKPIKIWQLTTNCLFTRYCPRMHWDNASRKT